MFISFCFVIKQKKQKKQNEQKPNKIDVFLNKHFIPEYNPILKIKPKKPNFIYKLNYCFKSFTSCSQTCCKLAKAWLAYARLAFYKPSTSLHQA